VARPRLRSPGARPGLFPGPLALRSALRPGAAHGARPGAQPACARCPDSGLARPLPCARTRPLSRTSAARTAWPWHSAGAWPAVVTRGVRVRGGAAPGVAWPGNGVPPGMTPLPARGVPGEVCPWRGTPARGATPPLLATRSAACARLGPGVARSRCVCAACSRRAHHGQPAVPLAPARAALRAASA
jgi:hypothetical protein